MKIPLLLNLTNNPPDAKRSVKDTQLRRWEVWKRNTPASQLPNLSSSHPLNSTASLAPLR